jgi:hypothetical protein
VNADPPGRQKPEFKVRGDDARGLHLRQHRGGDEAIQVVEQIDQSQDEQAASSEADGGLLLTHVISPPTR